MTWANRQVMRDGSRQSGRRRTRAVRHRSVGGRDGTVDDRPSGRPRQGGLGKAWTGPPGRERHSSDAKFSISPSDSRLPTPYDGPICPSHTRLRHRRCPLGPEDSAEVFLAETSSCSSTAKRPQGRSRRGGPRPALGPSRSPTPDLPTPACFTDTQRLTSM